MKRIMDKQEEVNQNEKIINKLVQHKKEAYLIVRNTLNKENNADIMINNINKILIKIRNIELKK